MLPLDAGVRTARSRAARAAFSTLFLLSLALGLGGTAAPARGISIDFGGFDHGAVVDGVGAISQDGLVIDVFTRNKGIGPDFAIIFDSTRRNTADYDLEGPNISGRGSWAGGNLAPDTFLGNLLIISENNDDDDGDGLIDDPDDEGSKPAGTIHMIFDTPIAEFGFSFVDVEGNSESMGSVEFFSGGASVGEIAFEVLASRQSNISFGDHTANRVDPFALMDALQVETIEEVIFKIGGSGAIAALELTPVPEPASVLMLGLGLSSLVALARSRARRGRGSVD